MYSSPAVEKENISKLPLLIYGMSAMKGGQTGLHALHGITLLHTSYLLLKEQLSSS